jgi:hypothetical protein
VSRSDNQTHSVTLTRPSPSPFLAHCDDYTMLIPIPAILPSFTGEARQCQRRGQSSLTPDCAPTLSFSFPCHEWLVRQCCCHNRLPLFLCVCHSSGSPVCSLVSAKLADEMGVKVNCIHTCTAFAMRSLPLLAAIA